ncbi:olfactory receptor 4D2-like [Carettochelys insculpta]|uniref:olfactory receptor 4D2-like n=1 Tax=Carettochelys insculpta TaxID=44489 RepID=UPI003EBEB8BD
MRGCGVRPQGCSGPAGGVGELVDGGGRAGLVPLLLRRELEASAGCCRNCLLVALLPTASCPSATLPGSMERRQAQQISPSLSQGILLGGPSHRHRQPAQGDQFATYNRQRTTEQQNLTSPVTESILLGLTQSPTLQQFLFIIFSFVYLTAWLGNVLIITTVISDHQLHTPMYFPLANLAFIDISDSTVSVPKMLLGLLSQSKTISFNQCILQTFFFHFIAGAVVFLLVVMAADCYVAIHKPLQYLTIMNQGVCMGLVAGTWLGGLAHSSVQIVLILQLPFCGPNVLDNFYCDVPQVIKLACTDTYLFERLTVSHNGVIVIVIFLLLLISYTIILVKIKTHLLEGKPKALSTCGTQIMVVCLIFVPCIFIYARPFRKFPMDKAVSVLYAVVTPMLNPIIYTLRNAKMQKAVQRLINRAFFSGRGIKA